MYLAGTKAAFPLESQVRVAAGECLTARKIVSSLCIASTGPVLVFMHERSHIIWILVCLRLAHYMEVGLLCCDPQAVQQTQKVMVYFEEAARLGKANAKLSAGSSYPSVPICKYTDFF